MTPDVLLTLANVFSVFVLGMAVGVRLLVWVHRDRRCGRCNQGSTK